MQGRPMMNIDIDRPMGAVIEVGTNSTKLFIGRLNQDNSLETITYQRKITRLGEGQKEGGDLLNEAMWRTASTVKAYCDLARDRGVRQIVIISTHVLRAAENPLEFIERVKVLTGLEMEILTEEQEALAARDGAMLDYGGGPDRSTVIIDIGGGSTEIVRGIWCRSIPVGVVNLTESFFDRDPPSDIDMVRASSRFRDYLLEEVKFMVPGDRVHLIGVGGTINAAAALCQDLHEYDPTRIDGYLLDEKKIQHIYERLHRVSLEKRREMMAFDPDRSDVIIAGMLILRVLFRYFHVESFRVSVKNVIHGTFMNKFAMGHKPRRD